MKEFIETLGKDGLKAAYNALSAFALYVTVALAVILIAAYFIVKAKAADKTEKFKSLSLGITVGYAVTLTLCISFFMIARLSVKGEIDVNFYLMLIFFALLFFYAVIATVLSFANKNPLPVLNSHLHQNYLTPALFLYL